MNKLEQIIKGIEEEKKFVVENYFMSEERPSFTEYKQAQAQMFAFDTALTVIAKLTNDDNEVIEEDEAIMEQHVSELEEIEKLKQIFIDKGLVAAITYAVTSE